MDRDLLIANILKCCEKKNEKPTNACFNAGCGKSFISDIRRGRVPALDKFVALAAYLDVPISYLVGDARTSPESAIAEIYKRLNAEGQEILMDYAEHLVATKKYTERGSLSVDAEAANE